MHGSDHVRLTFAFQHERGQRIVDDRQVNVFDLQQRAVRRGRAVLDEDGPLVNYQCRHALFQVRRRQDVLQIEPAIAFPHDAQARPIQFDFVDARAAVEQMFLVVEDDGGGHVEEIAAIEVVAAGHAQIADDDAAEQAQTGGFHG